MNYSAGSLVEHYEALISEYRADLERSLELAAGSSGDPAIVTDKINRVLIGEIARLKVQLIDLDIKLAQITSGAFGTTIRPVTDGAWTKSMPVYDAGDMISIAAGVTTYGFHPAEVSSAARGHRWSGPSTRSGFVAMINRAKPLTAQAIILKILAPKIKFLQVAVDGEAMEFKWESEQLLRFVIPALPEAAGPLPTEISFLTSECVVVAEVQPQYDDQRKVAFSTTGIRLLEFAGPL